MMRTTVPAGSLLLMPLGISTTSVSRLSVMGWLVTGIEVDLDISLPDPSYSVETASCLPSSAACSVCQASVAHFTRTGNSDTPEKTASLPSSACSAVRRRRAR